MASISGAIFLGAWKFPRNTAFTNDVFRNSKSDFEDYLRCPDPVGLGLSSSRVLDLFNSPLEPGAQLRQIGDFTEQLRDESPDATRDLIVYYVGHGYFSGGNRDLYVALASMDPDVPDTTGLRLASLGVVIKRYSKSFRVFYILDCCFAGEALRALQAGGEGVAAAAGAALKVEAPRANSATPRRGSALLCATSKDDFALAPRGLGRTVFSDALVETLRSGDIELGPRLTVAQVADLVWDRIKAKHRDAPEYQVRPVLHAPDQSDGDISTHVPLFPNSACRSGLPAVERFERAAVPQALRVANESPRGTRHSEATPENRQRARAGERNVRNAINVRWLIAVIVFVIVGILAIRYVIDQGSPKEVQQPKRSMLAVPPALSSGAPAQPAVGRTARLLDEPMSPVVTAPPLLPVYEQPPIPAEGYIWTPGYWCWDPGHDDYFWVPATWVLTPEPGLLWTPGYWGSEGGVFIWHAGHWGPHVGFYGGVYYGFGYGGRGFEGAYWQGGHLFYNRAVANVSTTNITHTYVRIVPVNNVNSTRVSYNGPGGVTAQPTPAEQQEAAETHTPPTAAQVKQQEIAARNPGLQAKANGGNPPIAATAKPGEFSSVGVVRARDAPAHPGLLRD
jgi:WXXGXW repeat (2 copies)